MRGETGRGRGGEVRKRERWRRVEDEVRDRKREERRGEVGKDSGRGGEISLKTREKRNEKAGEGKKEDDRLKRSCSDESKV
eukprot:514340-Hanusia_phi.AAC.1